MTLLWFFGGYIAGLFPDLNFLIQKIPKAKTTVVHYSKKHNNVFRYDIFPLFWFFLLIELLKAGLFIFVIISPNASLFLGFTLGTFFPWWSNKKPRSLIIYVLCLLIVTFPWIGIPLSGLILLAKTYSEFWSSLILISGLFMWTLALWVFQAPVALVGIALTLFLLESSYLFLMVKPDPLNLANPID